LIPCAALSALARELLVARRGDDHLRAHQPGELQREDRDPAGALYQHALPGDDAPVLGERVPGGDRGARQRGALLERQVGGQRHHAVLLEHDVLRQHAVAAAAERALVGVGRRRAAPPALEEAAGDAVADLEAGHAGAELRHLAGAVGERDEVGLGRHPVGAERDRQVAVIERAGRDLDQHLGGPGLGIGSSTSLSPSMPAACSR
jgi:hypothetical protein